MVAALNVQAVAVARDSAKAGSSQDNHKASGNALDARHNGGCEDHITALLSAR
jgi:hypothetical protein